MKIAIIGLGYVGLPLGLRFSQSDVSVLGLDVDPEKVDAINAGRSYIKHIESSEIAAVRESGALPEPPSPSSGDVLFQLRGAACQEYIQS